MRALVFFVFVLLATGGLKAQSNYESAYYVDSNGVRTSCLINNKFWKNTPAFIHVKSVASKKIVKIDVSNLEEFGSESFKFVNKKAEMQNPKEITDNSVYAQKMKFDSQQQLFKVLVDGKYQLLKYSHQGAEIFLYSVDGGKATQLVYGKIMLTYSTLAINDTYKNQLQNLSGNSDVKKLKYDEEQLVEYFVGLNKQKGERFKVYKTPFKVNHRTGISVGLIYNSMKLTRQRSFTKSSPIPFNGTYNFRLGFEHELILPYDNNRWSFLTDNSFNIMRFNEVAFSEEGYFTHELEMNYLRLDIGIGLRMNMYLRRKIRTFVQANMVYTFNTNSSLNYRRKATYINDSEFYDINQLIIAPSFSTGIFFDMIFLKIAISAPYDLLKKYPTTYLKIAEPSLVVGVSF